MVDLAVVTSLHFPDPGSCQKRG